GTALAGRLLLNPLRRWAIRCMCWLRGLPFDLIATLERDARAVLAPPPHMRVFHLVGLPLVQHLSSRRSRRVQRRLAPLGPNDGGGFLLGDVARLTGTIVPVWGADHYFQPADRFDPLIARLLAFVARDTARSPVPVG
ncbi:MAG: hypothetical protein AB7K24_21170, partial [Gemmataceae bacterium]